LPATAPATERQVQPDPAPVAKAAATPKRPVVRKKPKPSAPQTVKPTPKPAPAPVAVPAPEPGKSALKLETLTLPTGQADGLGTAPLAVPSPEALLQASQIQALQEELKALRAQTAKTNANLAEMQVQLQRAQSERVSLQLFYVVVVLLLMCAAALAWLLWERYRGQQAHDAGPSILGDLPSVSVQPARDEAVAQKPVQATPASGTGQAPAADKSFKSSQPWWPAQQEPAAPKPAATAASGTSKPAVPGTLQELNHAFTNTRLQDVDDSNFGVVTHEEVDLDIDMSSWAGLGDSSKTADTSSESILDIRQQAEFFVSLGQTERALVVLKKQIAESSVPSPAIYLDLLSLFHSLGYKTDFREYRTAFNRLFNCVLPDFPAYHLEGTDLLAYPDELARLTQVWNRKEVLSYLHACIFRSEQVSAQPSFELAAFRDLLLLQAIAEQVIGSDAA